MTDDDNGDAAPQEDRSGEPLVDLIELLFFAYRDFISDPDAILVQYGFGRAHHRVIHFVNRNPGLTVADLLDILKITKQSKTKDGSLVLGQSFPYSGWVKQRPSFYRFVRETAQRVKRYSNK